MSRRVVLPRIAPLQHIIAEPITDRAEIAALQEAHRRAKSKKPGGKAKESRHRANGASHRAAKKGR